MATMVLMNTTMVSSLDWAALPIVHGRFQPAKKAKPHFLDTELSLSTGHELDMSDPLTHVDTSEILTCPK